VDANESSLGSRGEDRQGGHRDVPEQEESAPAPQVTPPVPSPDPPVEGAGGEPDQSRMAPLQPSRPKRETAQRKPARPRAKAAAAPRTRRAAGPATTAARTRSRSAAPRKKTIDRRASAKTVDRGADHRREEARSLPQLALDGAVEAAKLPVKVSANITIRALDAVTKSLRRR
jgi:hypothetical protein